MGDPDPETPAEAIERLRKEIRDLKRLRAQIPQMILEPYVEDAAKHIKEAAARLAVTPDIPAAVATYITRLEAEEAAKPKAVAIAPEALPAPGAIVTLVATEEGAVVVAPIPGVRRSPEEWEILVLTEAGRLISVKPEELAPRGAAAPGPAAPGPGPGLKSGDRVRDKTTGKTGFISEIVDDKATVALDEGGFIVRPLGDLEKI